MRSPGKILITGGSGLIGQRLTVLLQERGHEVTHLGRSGKNGPVRTFIWDPGRNEIEPGVLQDVDAIIHLAGAGIAEKRWNEKRKREILLSRTQSAQLLATTLKNASHHVSTFVSASGISYYGLGDAPPGGFVETDPSATDYLARVTVAWEKGAVEIEDRNIRTVMIRTGVVLSRRGGALEKLAMPVKFFLGAPLGSGKQYVNWIHLEDLCGIYVKAVEDQSMYGAFNAVAPNPIRNLDLTRVIAKVLKRPLWMPPVPGFFVKLIAGEVAEFVLKGGKISSAKIEQAGFDFQFRTVDKALEDLLR